MERAASQPFDFEGDLDLALVVADAADAFTLPLPNDAFTFFGRAAGMPFWECVFWGSLGSLVGESDGVS